MEGDRKFGKSGADLVIPVPQGTVIRDVETGRILADMFDENEDRVLLRGGAGGKGNACYVTSTNRAPTFA